VSLRDHLDGIRSEYGKLTPAVVVEAARPDGHPLHERFEWDDAVAGEAWRRQQAHQLIRSVRVVSRPATDTEAEQTVRAFHAIRDTDGDVVYEPAEKVAQDPVLTELVLRDMEREWKQLYRRYGHFTEFVAMVNADLADEAA